MSAKVLCRCSRGLQPSKVMLSNQIADRLRHARKALGLTQRELARRAEVSTRLVAEVERGERKNVSLATVLRLLAEAGISVRLSGPVGRELPLRESARHNSGRATWGGQQIRLAQEGVDDPGATPGRDRLAAVTLVSAQAFAVARSRPAGRVAAAPPAPSRKR